MTSKNAAYQIDKSDPGHRRIKQQLEKNMKTPFASPSKNRVKKMAITKLHHTQTQQEKHNSILQNSNFEQRNAWPLLKKNNA